MKSGIAPSIFRKKNVELPGSKYNLLQKDEECYENSLSGNTCTMDGSIMSEHRTSTIIISKRFAYFMISLLSAILLIETFLLIKQTKFPWAPKSPVPDFSTHQHTFTRQLDWEYSPQSQNLWESLIPNSGLILINDPAQYDGLGPGLDTSATNAQVYGVAVTHQYHCLKMIRDNFYGLVTRDEAFLEKLTITPGEELENGGRVDHIFHCFDYLRQTVLCNADTTVEGRSKTAENHIDGYGPVHQCRNWDEVISWMTEQLPPDAVYRKQQ